MCPAGRRRTQESGLETKHGGEMKVTDVNGLVGGIVAAYSAAVYSKNVDAFMQLYASNVRVFDAWGVWSYGGASAWRNAAGGWLGSLGSERVQATFEDVEVLGTQDLCYASAIVTYASISEAGERLRAMQNRVTWVLAFRNDGMKIVHEHTSAPAGFEDMKVMLSRDDP